MRLLFTVIAAATVAVIADTTTNRPWNYASTTPSNFVSPCACSNYSNIWLDVMLVIDSSTAMTSHGIEELTNYLETAFLRMSVGQTKGHFTRIGAVGYGDNATLLHPLTDFQSVDDLLSRFSPKMDGSGGSNIESAIRLAQVEFESGGHRDNVKKVLVIAASHYEPGASEDPVQVAQQFREDGGVIITLEYVQTHGASVPVLKSLATPCYSLSNSNEDLRVNDLLNMFCNANCFCYTNWNPYATDPVCPFPDGGCYYPVTIPAAEVLAKRYCENHNGGMLVKIEDAAKGVFVNSLFNNKNEKTWIGLELSRSFAYLWEDGSQVGSYQPFVTHNMSIACVSQGQGTGFNSNWYPEDCYADYMYTCQATPCSADKLCPQ